MNGVNMKDAKMIEKFDRQEHIEKWKNGYII